MFASNSTRGNSCAQIEELDIDPRLRTKYLERKEQKRRREEAGEEPILSRSAACIVVTGLFAASYSWVDERARKFMEAHAVFISALIMALFAGGVCLVTL